MMIISWSGALPAFLTHKPCALLHFFFQDNWPLHYKGKCRHRFKKCMLRGQLTDYRSRNSILQPQVSLAPRQSWSTFFCPCTSRARWPRSSKQKVDLNLIMTSVLSHHLSDKKKKNLCCSPTWLNSPATLGEGLEETKPTSWFQERRQWHWWFTSPGEISIFAFMHPGRTQRHHLRL